MRLIIRDIVKGPLMVMIDEEATVENLMKYLSENSLDMGYDRRTRNLCLHYEEEF